MSDLLGCLLEPLIEGLFSPHFNPAHRRRAWWRLLVSSVVDGGACAGGVWLIWAGVTAHDRGLVTIGGLLAGLFGALLGLTWYRFGQLLRH